MALRVYNLPSRHRGQSSTLGFAATPDQSRLDLTRPKHPSPAAADKYTQHDIKDKLHSSASFSLYTMTPLSTVSATASTSSTPVDLMHHLSTEARMRKPNPMKAIWKLTRRKPNMVSLANGESFFRHCMYTTRCSCLVR